MRTIAAEIAARAQAIENCQKSGNVEWEQKHKQVLDRIIKNGPANGSGFDCGTKLVFASANKLVFTTEFHHLNENGYYTGWTQHRITVRPEFGGLNVHVSGRNRAIITEYIGDVIHTWLSALCPESLL